MVWRMQMQIRPCDVCVVFGDRRLRKVAFCSVCGAWICDACRPRTIRRAIAMFARKLGK
jgi:hypothetical protein